MIVLSACSAEQASDTRLHFQALIDKADSLYDKRDYLHSGETFMAAFRAGGDSATPDLRYNAACSWALAGKADSAFYLLNWIAEKDRFADLTSLSADRDLRSLAADSRWKVLLEQIGKNKEEAEKNFDKRLVAILDTIYRDDQSLRMQLDSLQKSGAGEDKMTALWFGIKRLDSINLVKIKQIVRDHGWLGADVVGKRGNDAMFLVIQHADIETQEHFLPTLKLAATQGKADRSQLALLIDRIEMDHDRPQVYGSQLLMVDGKYQLYKIEDERNVNKRRAEMGLEPIEKYLRRYFNIEYKPAD